MHEMLPLTHGRRVAIQMWSAPESRAAAQGPRPMGLNMRPPAHAPPALERALARAASSLGRRADMLWLAARVFHTGLPARASSPAGRGRSARPSRRSMATADPRRAWRCRRWSRHRAGTCARRGCGLRQYSPRGVCLLLRSSNLAFGGAPLVHSVFEKVWRVVGGHAFIPLDVPGLQHALQPALPDMGCGTAILHAHRAHAHPVLRALAPVAQPSVELRPHRLRLGAFGAALMQPVANG